VEEAPGIPAGDAQEAEAGLPAEAEIRHRRWG
jgi:hypothetical protein